MPFARVGNAYVYHCRDTPIQSGLDTAQELGCGDAADSVSSSLADPCARSSHQPHVANHPVAALPSSQGNAASKTVDLQAPPGLPAAPAYFHLDAEDDSVTIHGHTGVHWAPATQETGGWQLVAVFDTLHHVRLQRVRQGASNNEAVAEVLQASSYLPQPVAFRVLTRTLPQLPDLQVVLWSEPNTGHRVLPVKYGEGAMSVCSVNIPFDAPPFKIARQMAAHCEGLDRLCYKTAQGTSVILADGQQTSRFQSGQFAGADHGHV